MNPLTVLPGIKPWGDCVVDGVPTLGCLEIVFGNIIFMASAFVVLALFVMFVVGAFGYLTSFGNAEKVKKAQGTLRMALIGFIIFVSAYLILNIIQILFLNGGTYNLFEFNLSPVTN
jgi:hypothetical protein